MMDHYYDMINMSYDMINMSRDDRLKAYSRDSGRISSVPADLQRRANAIARRNGYGRATVVIGGTQDRVLLHVPYGYRKGTTGEYVPHAYRKNFGWKNTSYQSAETVVEVAVW